MKRGRTHVTQGMVIRTQHNHIRRNAGTSVLTAEGNGEVRLGVPTRGDTRRFTEGRIGPYGDRNDPVAGPRRARDTANHVVVLALHLVTHVGQTNW